MRKASAGVVKKLEEYAAKLERSGFQVHYPRRDTNQDDPVDLAIVTQNRRAIITQGYVNVYWKREISDGSLFDLGMSFAAGHFVEKPIFLINEVKPTPTKSFDNVLLALDEKKQGKVQVRSWC